MNRFLLYISALLMALQAFAQDLTVEGMMLTNEVISAAQQRKDLNGVPCALVKVQLPVEGTAFEGAIVGDVDYKINEYYVYMPKGSKLLNIKCPNHFPLMVNFADLGIGGVEPNRVYHLRVRPQTQAGSVPADPHGNYVVFNVNPPSAIVTVDDQNRVNLNSSGSGNMFLPYGVHTYRVEAPGCATESGQFDITSAKKATVAIELQSELSTLTVKAESPNTVVLINDESKGPAPWTGTLFPGLYRIEGVSPGYRISPLTVNLGKNENKTVTIPALQPVYGCLNVNYEPIGAAIIINDHEEETSPAVICDLTATIHKVTISCDGYLPEVRNVVVAEGETKTIEGSLTPVATTQSQPQAANPATAPAATSAEATSGNEINGHEYVDLALPSGTKWATCNIGANSPEEIGSYFEWGDIYAKPVGDTYIRQQTFYWMDPENIKKAGGIDDDMNLVSKYDVASVVWGKPWRLPTYDEIIELKDNCQWIWTTKDGREGYLVKGDNGASIFLPATGYISQSGGAISNLDYGYYWGATAFDNESSAWTLRFCKDWHNSSYDNRRDGLAIRPVAK